MEPLYFVTAWDYYEGKTQQQHVKQFNIHIQHLPTVRKAFCRPQCWVQNGSQQQQSFNCDIVGGGKTLGGLSTNRIAGLVVCVDAIGSVL